MVDQFFVTKFFKKLVALNKGSYSKCLCLGCITYLEQLKDVARLVSTVITDPLMIQGIILYMGNQLLKVYLTNLRKICPEETYDLVFINHWFEASDAITISTSMGLLYSATKIGGTIVLRERVKKNNSPYPRLSFYNELIKTLGLKTLKSHLCYFNRYCIVCMILVKETY